MHSSTVTGRHSGYIYATAIILPHAEDGIAAPAFTYRFQFDELHDLEDMDIDGNGRHSQDGEEEEDSDARVLSWRTRRPPRMEPTKRRSRK